MQLDWLREKHGETLETISTQSYSLE